jgi:hypothetical protein
MKSLFGISVTFLLWATTSSSAYAFGCAPWVYYYCPPTYCVSYQWQPSVSYRPEWKAEQVPCIVQKVSYRQEITKVNVTNYVPQMFDQKVRTSYYVAIPTVVERPVTTCVMVPIMAVDPCSGCCFVSCCPQWVTSIVKCTAYSYQLQSRDDVVKVCKWVPTPAVIDQVRYIPVVTQEPSWTVRYSCVMVPCQTMICVPVYTCCYP